MYPHRYVRKPRKKLASINNFDEDASEESSRAPEENQKNIPPHESAEEETVSKRSKGKNSSQKNSFPRATKKRIAVINNFSDEDEATEDFNEYDIPLSKLGDFADDSSSENESGIEIAASPNILSRDWRWKNKSAKIPKLDVLYKKPDVTEVDQPYAYFRKYFTDHFLEKNCNTTNLRARYSNKFFIYF